MTGTIKLAGKLDIKGQDQIKRVYETGGGITYIINYGRWQPPTESYGRGEPWQRGGECAAP